MYQKKVYCQLPWTRMKIQCDGNVTMCCHQSSSGSLGNLLEVNDWKDLWFSQKAKEIRKSVSRSQLHEACNTKECPFRYYNLSFTQSFLFNENAYPLDIEIDLHASHCNYGGKNASPETTCVMCPRQSEYVRHHIITKPDKTFEILEKVKPLMPHLTSMSLLGLSEIFWQNKVFEIFDFIDFKKYRKELIFWSNTNGSVFDHTKMKTFSEYVCKSRLYFSLDACTSETYLKIRKNNLFERVVGNLKTWNEYRKKLNANGHNHTVGIFNNINILNVSEVPKMVEMAAEIGVDMITLTPTNNVCNMPELSTLLVNKQNWELFSDVEKEAYKIAKTHDIELNIVRPLALGFEQQLVQINLL